MSPIHDFVEDPRDEGNFHVVRSGHEPVGFCKADRRWPVHSGAASSGDWEPGAFLAGAQHQGRAFGAAALAALPDHLRQIRDRREPVFLTVNLRNATAHGLYVRPGWTDTGRLREGGRSDPQRVGSFGSA